MLESKLSFLAMNYKGLTTNDISKFLGYDVIKTIKYIFKNEILLYDKLKVIEDEHSVENGNNSNKNVKRSTIKDFLKTVDWCEIFERSSELGYTTKSYQHILELMPNVKKSAIIQNKHWDGENQMKFIMGHYDYGSNYDIVFSPFFNAIEITNCLELSNIFFKDEELLVDLKIISNKHFDRIVKCFEIFNNRNDKNFIFLMKEYLLSEGLNQSEIYVIIKCFVESCINGMLKGNFDTSRECACLENYFKMHKQTGIKMIKEF